MGTATNDQVRSSAWAEQRRVADDARVTFEVPQIRIRFPFGKATIEPRVFRQRRPISSQESATDGGAVLGGMGLIGVLVLIVLVLAIAALANYLFFTRR
jgi:hypothetical protein